MSKEFDTKSIPSNCSEECVGPIIEREFAIGRKLLKISLKIFTCLLIFCLGFIMSELSYTVRHQQIEDPKDDFHQFVYVYDTKQKLEDYYKMMERAIFDELGLPPESSEARWQIDSIKRECPLVRVGPFIVFTSSYDNPGRPGSREFSVDCLFDSSHGKTSRSRLVSLTRQKPFRNLEPGQLLTFSSPLEKDWSTPRFCATLFYSNDGVYKKNGSFSVSGKDGLFDRTYIDSTGSGVFDTVSVVENGEWVDYRLNGLTWEREVPVPPEPQSPLPPGSPGLMGILPPGTVLQRTSTPGWPPVP